MKLVLQNCVHCCKNYFTSRPTPWVSVATYTASGGTATSAMALCFYCVRPEALTAVNTSDWPSQPIAAVPASDTVSLCQYATMLQTLSLCQCATMLHDTQQHQFKQAAKCLYTQRHAVPFISQWFSVRVGLMQPVYDQQRLTLMMATEVSVM